MQLHKARWFCCMTKHNFSWQRKILHDKATFCMTKQHFTWQSKFYRLFLSLSIPYLLEWLIKFFGWYAKFKKWLKHIDILNCWKLLLLVLRIVYIDLQQKNPKTVTYYYYISLIIKCFKKYLNFIFYIYTVKTFISLKFKLQKKTEISKYIVRNILPFYQKNYLYHWICIWFNA